MNDGSISLRERVSLASRALRGKIRIRAAAEASSSRYPATPTIGFVKSDVGVEPVTNKSFLEAYANVGTVHTALRRIALDSASVPLRIYRRAKGKGSDPQLLDPFSDPIARVFERPNPRQGRTVFWTKFHLYLQASGDSFLLGDRGGDGLTGVPKFFWLLRPDWTEPVPGEGASIARYDYYPGGQGWLTKPIPYRPNEVYQAQLPNLTNEYRGLSTLIPAKPHGELEASATEHWKTFFKNGARTGTTLETDAPLTAQQVDEWTDFYEKKHSKIRNFWKFLLLPHGLKRKADDLNPKDADFVNQFELTREQQLSICAVPPALVGVFKYANYANAEAQIRIYWENTIIPILEILQQDLTWTVLPWFGRDDLFAQFDLDAVAALQDAQFARIKTRLDSGMLTFNAGRQIVGQPRIVGGDVAIYAGQFTPIGAEVRTGQNPVGGRSARKWIDDGERSAIRKGAAATLAPYEREATAAFSEYLTNQGERLASRVAHAKAAKLPSADDVWDDELEVGKADHLILKVTAKIVRDRGQQAAEAVDEAAEFIVSDPAVAAFLEDNAAAQARNLSDTARAALRELISAANDENMTTQELANAIREDFAFSGARASRIARTETGRAYNAATSLAWKQMPEVVESKEWVTAGDERVRDSHAELDGQIVPIDESFGNGGDYPGDPSLPPEESINCRCTMRPTVTEAKGFRINQDAFDKLFAAERNGKPPLAAVGSHR